jgi:hypothetical protein
VGERQAKAVKNWPARKNVLALGPRAAWRECRMSALDEEAHQQPEDGRDEQGQEHLLDPRELDEPEAVAR